MPKSAIKALATRFKIFSHYRLTIDGSSDELDNIKGELAKGNPVMIGIFVYRPGPNIAGPFDNLRAGETFSSNITPIWDAHHKFVSNNSYNARFSGHGVIIVGYQERWHRFKIMNSWGNKWADHGYGWIDYQTLRKIMDEAHVMVVAPPPPPSPSPTCSLSVSPNVIVEGQAAILSYGSLNASNEAINNGVGVVAANGFLSVSPQRTTTYVGTFEGAGGMATCTATLRVTPRPVARPAIVSFTAAPGRISAGQSATISWSVTDATSVKIDNGIGEVAGNSMVVGPGASTIYTLTATNSGGSSTATATVLVDKPSVLALPNGTCGKIELVNGGDKQKVIGFVGEVKDLEWVKAHANGADVEVDVRPWPQCEALTTLDAPLARATVDGLSSEILGALSGSLRAGDHLRFDVKTPSYPSYVYVAYIQADGTVIDFNKLSGGLPIPRSANSLLHFGTGGEWGSFHIAAPFGREMLIVLAAKRPLFTEALPAQETDREFLTELRRVLLAGQNPQADNPDVVASYDAIITTER